MVECGHRCAACGETSALEKAHIVSWSTSKDHGFQNLVVLCAVCHTNAHDDAWDNKTLQEYKKAPWVARYKATPAPSTRSSLVSLKLDLTKGDYDHEKQRILAAVSAALDLCPKDILELSIRDGSVIATLRIPSLGAQRLRDPECVENLRQLIAPVALLDVSVRDEEVTVEQRRAFGKFF